MVRAGHRADRRCPPGPDRDHTVAASNKNYQYSTNTQVLIDASTRLVVAVGQPPPGTRNDCQAYTTSKIDRAVARATVPADGGYPGTGLLIPHRRQPEQTELPRGKDRDNTDHHRVQARLEHTIRRHEDLEDPA